MAFVPDRKVGNLRSFSQLRDSGWQYIAAYAAFVLSFVFILGLIVSI